MKPSYRLPCWFKVQLYSGEKYTRIKNLLKEYGLHTVCQEARCPNIWECWNSGTATFMILGELCSRNCTFCGVHSSKKPPPPDPAEPEKIAETVSRLGLSWAVLTSVTRDDLPDFGAGHFARCAQMIEQRNPECGVELLIPDFRGNTRCLDTVIYSGARVIAHNVETVPRLYQQVRPEADYRRSIKVLEYLAKKADSRFTVKSSFIVGLGETLDEIQSLIQQLASSGCQALTVGQYLPPSKKHYPLHRFYTPQDFRSLAQMAREAGISYVAAGPLVRSSYRAHQLIHPQASR